ncbi:MAG: DUF4837 family protein [Fidelibacterota bacterium]|nr:MAG: DUF4837 family protein [Candidatus Neomarinimicrobiota bacterium]
MRSARVFKITIRSCLTAFLVSFLLVRCGYTPPVIGQEDVLVIVASEEDRPLLEPLLADVLGRSMATPAPEPYFKIRWETPAEFETFQHYKSLVVASLSNPADSTGDVLIRRILGEKRVTEAMQGGNPIYVTSDLLARGQIFMGLSALDAIHAQKELSRLRSWIFDQFEQQLRIRQYRAMYRGREQKNLAKELEEKYGWRLRIQRDYLTIKELPDQNFVWLGRGYPFRWLSIHWIEQADTMNVSPELAWQSMEYIADSLFADIYIDSLFRSTEIGDQNGHTIFILRGVWGHRTQVGGGPFFTYVFRDSEQNRLYFISGVVFNPGGPKALLIRQQEVIGRTFHTFEEPPKSRVQPQGDNLT